MGYLSLAFRNLLLHRRRTLITVLAITFGYTALGVFGGLVNNIFRRLKDQAITVEKLGHLTMAKQGFFMNGKMEPEAYLWNRKEMDEILGIVRQDPDVKLATPRIRLFGIASNGKASTIFLSEAVVPEDDQVLTGSLGPGRDDVTGIVSLQPDRPDEVAIGSELSSILGVGEDQYLTILTNTSNGMANAMDAKVGFVYNTGNPATNDKYVLMPYDFATRLYDTEGAERIVLMLHDLDKLSEVQARLTAALAAKGHAVEMQTWNELSLFYERVTAMFGVIFRVIAVIITLVILLTLLNTMFMAVSERTREIGTLRAMGMKRRDVIRVFCYEGLMMGVIGCALSSPLILGIGKFMEFAKVSFIPPVASSPIRIMLVLRPERLAAVFLLFIAAAFIASFIASRIAARKKIVEALGYV